MPQGAVRQHILPQVAEAEAEAEAEAAEAEVVPRSRTFCLKVQESLHLRLAARRLYTVGSPHQPS